MAAKRQNGKADELPPEAAPVSRWRGRRDGSPGIPGFVVNLTPVDEPGQNGDAVEIHSPVFRVVGPDRAVIRMNVGAGKTRSGKSIPQEQSDKHSGGQWHGSCGETGYASFHTEAVLQSSGEVRDVWHGLRHLGEKHPALISGLGWYSADRGRLIFDEAELRMVALKPLDEKLGYESTVFCAGLHDIDGRRRSVDRPASTQIIVLQGNSMQTDVTRRQSPVQITAAACHTLPTNAGLAQLLRRLDCDHWSQSTSGQPLRRARPTLFNASSRCSGAMVSAGSSRSCRPWCPTQTPER